MELEKVLGILVTEFEKGSVTYALIGGYALGLLGVPRSTVALDFLVNRGDMTKIHAIMSGLDYEKRYGSENVSQYVSALRIFGEVDFIHAFREISTSMLARALSMKIFGGRLSVRVLRPEDIIGLKIQAVVNNPERKDRELGDIRSLAGRHGSSLDWDLIFEYSALFNLSDLLEKIRESSGTTD